MFENIWKLKMHGGNVLTSGLLLVTIASVAAQTETNVRIEGPVNNLTINTDRTVNIIVCDASRPSKLIGSTKTKQKPDSSSRSRSSLLPKPQDCPEDEGFFQSQVSNQCLKAFLERNHEGFWEDADQTCKAAGMVLAQPAEPVSLRRQLVAKYGDRSYWLGARGDGRHMRYQRDNEILDIASPYWQPGMDEDYVTTDSCLGLSANDYVLREYPDEPYWSWDCAHRFRKFPLCENVCPAGSPFQENNGNCFYFGTESLTWEDARSKCQVLGNRYNRTGDLAELDNPTNSVSDVWLKEQVKGKYPWLGGHNPSNNRTGEWIWAYSGRPVASNLWDPNQPSGDGWCINALPVDRTNNFLNDAPCDTIHYLVHYVCQLF